MEKQPCVEKRPEFDSLIDEIYSNTKRIFEIKESLELRINKIDGHSPPTEKLNDNVKTKSPSCVNEHLVEIKHQLAKIGDELNIINQRFVSQVG